MKKHLHPGACSGVGCALCLGAIHNTAARRAWKVTDEACALWLAENPWANDPNRRPGTALPKQQAPPVVETGIGPGTKLKELLATLGIKPAANCDCNALARQMDEWGVAGCDANHETILARLRGNAKNYGWLDKITAAVNAVVTGVAFKINPLDPYPGLLDEALRLARRALELPDDAKAVQIAMDAEIEMLHGVIPPNNLAGRGIVISAGGPTYFIAAWVCIWLLRKFGCVLPVEVWHIGPQEMDWKMTKLLESLGNVRCIDSTIYETPTNGWQNKLIALKHTRFKEVLALDADQVPTIDPSYLLDLTEFHQHGAVFWPDRREDGCLITRTAFSIARLPVPSGANVLHKRPDCATDYIPFETGQLLIDRANPDQWRALLLAAWIAENHNFWWNGPNRHTWHLYGDKDACYLAWRRWEKESGKSLLTLPTDSPGWFGSNSIGGGFLQYDFRKQLVFQHRCQPYGIKWKLPAANNYDNGPRFLHFNLCKEALHELDIAWDKKIEPFIPGGNTTWDRYTVFDDIWEKNEYHLPTRFSPDDVVIDVGANVGAFAKSALDRGAGLVVAFEPVPSNYEKLKTNLAVHIKTGRLVLFPVGAWRSDRPEMMLGALQPDGAAHSGGWTIANTGPTVMDVRVVPFDATVLSVIGDRRIRFLKLDCEGAEFPILATSGILDRVDEIALEWHMRWYNEDGVITDARTGIDSPDALEALLISKGFNVHTDQRASVIGGMFAKRKG